MHEDLLTVDELRKRLNVTKAWVYRHTHRNLIPVIRLSSRCIRFRWSDIERWLHDRIDTPKNNHPPGTVKEVAS